MPNYFSPLKLLPFTKLSRNSPIRNQCEFLLKYIWLKIKCMKTKLTNILLLSSSILFLASCGGSSEESTNQKTDSTATEPLEGPTFESTSNQETNLNLSIQNYHFGGAGDEFNFTPSSFTITSSEWNMKNDSTGVLKMSNYTKEEIADGLKDEHAEIKIEFITRNGNLLSAGEYKDGTFEPFAAKTTITTNKGTTYFNWVKGMPETGTVTINYVDSNNICGEINMSSDNKDVLYIGVVSLSGTFKI